MTDRRRFLRGATLAAATVASGTVFLSREPRINADDPSPTGMLVGPQDQAVNVHALVCGSGSSPSASPALLNDGTFALPVSVRQDPAYSPAADILATWTVADVRPDDFASNDDDGVFLLAVDRKVVRQAGRPGSLTMPHPDIFRFQVEHNDFAGSYDSDSGSRRSEIVAQQQDGVGEGTVWSSFCFILGSTPHLADAGRGIIHQWHSVDLEVGRTPALFVDVANSMLTLRTCSSSNLYGDRANSSQSSENGVSVVHYSAELPAAGEKTYITLQATFGENGHLNAWINGQSEVDTDTPIGYYRDLHDGSGRNILGYPHWGLYTTNQPDTEVVYIANPEWGAASLWQRIATPLPVPALI